MFDIERQFRKEKEKLELLFSNSNIPIYENKEILEQSRKVDKLIEKINKEKYGFIKSGIFCMIVVFPSNRQYTAIETFNKNNQDWHY